MLLVLSVACTLGSVEGQSDLSWVGLSKIVFIPQTLGGMNNQIIMVMELLNIAKQVQGVACMPKAKTDAYVTHKLPPVPLSHLLDVPHLTQCVATKFGIHFATRTTDVEACEYVMNITAAKYDIWKDAAISPHPALPEIAGWTDKAQYESAIHIYPDAAHPATVYTNDPAQLLGFPHGTLQH